MLDGRGAGVFKAGHHSDWTVCFHLIGEGDGKAEASVPAVRLHDRGAAEMVLQMISACKGAHTITYKHMHLDYL